MNLSELKVRAFGLHIDKTIAFTPGLNVIVGESEEGKSTLVRALYLLIENSPRGGEKLYQSWLTDKKLMIQLKDDADNVVKRTRNKYYLNDGDPLKAFGTGVPEPVRELFNFKEINWQKQHDRHYLLFSTGGSAGKLLNSATGMSDQETIIDAIKQMLSHSKSEVKRHKKNNEVHLQTTERLKDIVRYRLKAEAIVYLDEEADELQIKADRLANMLTELETIKETYTKYAIAKEYILGVDLAVGKIKEIRKFNEHITKLRNIITKLESIKIVNIPTILKSTKALHAIHSKKLEYDSLKSKTESLKRLIIQIEEAKEIQQEYSKEIKLKQEQLDAAFNELGYCPLCERKVEDEHTCSGG